MFQSTPGLYTCPSDVTRTWNAWILPQAAVNSKSPQFWTVISAPFRFTKHTKEPREAVDDELIQLAKLLSSKKSTRGYARSTNKSLVTLLVEAVSAELNPIRLAADW